MTVDLGAVAANWRLAERIGGAPAGAAVKADAYGLGAAPVVRRLLAEGARDFFVAGWAEAAELLPLVDGARLHVLHGFLPAELAHALASPALPVISTPAQARAWAAAAPGRACSLMVDSGMNRLGLAPADLAAADGLSVDLLMSHLACADEPGHPATAAQRARFLAVNVPHRRRSLANSAGVFEGAANGFDLTRPGLALYGGTPHPAAGGQIAQAVRIEAQVLQTRDLAPGETAGYGATFTAGRPTRLAVLALGYADGFRRAFSGTGHALAGGVRCPVAGRVSMDLTTVDITDAPPVAEGDWLELALDLPAAAAASGLSQYELLTGLGRRFDRRHAGAASPGSRLAA